MEKAVGNISLPVLDLKKARDPAQRLTVARHLVHALETVGFLYVDNMDGFEPEKLLQHTRWFFETLTQQEREQVARKLWNPDSQNYYRGYFPTHPDVDNYKEGFEIGEEEPAPGEIKHPFFTEGNAWPQGVEGADQFREDMRRYFTAFLSASTDVHRLISLGSGLGEDWFNSTFAPDSLSTLRLLHYPSRPAHTVAPAFKDGDTVVCCAEHSDTGFLTLLATFQYNGLEIQLDNGQWMAVPCRPNSLVMNIGDLLSTMSGGRFKATRHRVVDKNVNRYSVPFFLEPRYEADITRVMPKPANITYPPPAVPVKAGCELYGPWLIDRLRRFIEYKEMLDLL